MTATETTFHEPVAHGYMAWLRKVESFGMERSYDEDTYGDLSEMMAYEDVAQVEAATAEALATELAATLAHAGIAGEWTYDNVCTVRTGPVGTDRYEVVLAPPTACEAPDDYLGTLDGMAAVVVATLAT